MINNPRNILTKFLILIFILLLKIDAFGQTPCEFGLSNNFPCNNIEFVGQISLFDFGASAGNDCWGWTDPLDGKEYAIMGLDNGTGFVDISDPVNPVIKVVLPSHVQESNIWRDIKVYNNYAFIVSETANHGMQIFDLTKLRDATPSPTEDAHLDSFGKAHNIAINENTGYAYILGAADFGGGPIFINIQDPLNPINEGGYANEGYTHDAQIINYNGVDTDHSGKELFFGANEASIVIVDVSDKNSPSTIANFTYSSVGYTHQLWISDDQQFLYVGDETDELNSGINTRTIIYDISDLDNPQLLTEYFGPTLAIDHNLYVNNNKLYLANYTAGLRILDISDINNANTNEIGFFDTFTQNDLPNFEGSWSVYPYFPSGNIIISDINKGLIIVKENYPIPEPEIEIPNDCVNSISVCGNEDLELITTGNGQFDEIETNVCNDTEHNSIWLSLTPEISGTLGFTLTPTETNLNENYNFWVFGPNATCENLGNAIRCSTTNPQTANLSNNLTGMNATETDVFEGPDADGNSFVQWLNVIAGESYYIVIDSNIDNSSFNLEWTGTALFPEAPTNQMSPSFPFDLFGCDTDNDGIAFFDLTFLENLVIGNQSDIVVTYYESLLYAELRINGIENPTNYEVNNSSTIIYMLLTNSITNCFTVLEKELTVANVTISQPPNLSECDDDIDGFQVFDLTQQDILISGVANNPLLSYFYSTGGGEVPIINPESFINTRPNQQEIYARLEDPTINCDAIVSFMVQTYAKPIANPISDWFVCDNNDENIGFFNFNFETLNDQVLLNQDATQFFISYHSTENDALNGTNNLPLIYTNEIEFTQERIYVRIENINNTNCFDSTFFDLNVYQNPIFDLNSTAYFCSNIENYILEIEINDPQDNYNYEWTNALGNIIANTQNLSVNEAGDYTVTATTTNGNNCVVIKTVEVLSIETAIIQNTIIKEYLTDDNFSVEIEVSGLGIYEYAIDDIDGPYQSESIFLDVSSGLHEVFVRENHGCGIISDEIVVFGFPKFFTPNGDGSNEFWKVGITLKNDAKLIIYDRYGKVMVQITPGLNQSWDGFYHNNPAPQSDYWFTVELTNSEGKSIVRKGHFSLIRI